MPYLGIFGQEFKKNIVIIEVSTLEFVKSEFLTYTVNFGIGSAFSKSPGSAFSEDPGPGPGPLYKVCRWKYSNISLFVFINSFPCSPRNRLAAQFFRYFFCKVWQSPDFLIPQSIFKTICMTVRKKRLQKKNFNLQSFQ